MRGSVFRLAVYAPAAIVIVVSGSGGAPLAVLRAQVPTRDSLRYLQQARAAQSAFERYRIAHLPRRQASATPPCEIRIGRFCYWHTPDDSVVAEPSGIVRARERLLNSLDALSERSRGDEWIAGQRIRYLVEAGYDSSAIVASRECWATAWWCELLRGFALHAAQRYEDAEQAFDSALAGMPDSARCRWNDISLLLEDDDRNSYQAMPCGSLVRSEFERRFWQLADPSYLVPGNDRRTEHFSRMLLTELSATAHNAYGLPWGDDLRELLIRYGSPLSYSTVWTTTPFEAAPLIGHEREPSYHFAALGMTTDIAQWDVRAARAQERYSPAYLDSLTDLDAQFGMFRRGDSALIVAVYSDTSQGEHLSGLGVMDFDTVSVAPSWSSDIAHVRPSLRTRMILAPWKAVVVGVERYDPRTHWGQRARQWLSPPTNAAGAPEISTLLLYDGGDTSAVESLHEALGRAFTSETVSRDGRLGLYWEVYGANDSTTSPADSALGVSITVTPTGGSFMHRLAQALRIAPRVSPLVITWHEVPGTGGISYRSVVLDLRELPAGSYRVELAVGADSTRRATTMRSIRLR